MVKEYILDVFALFLLPKVEEDPYSEPFANFWCARLIFLQTLRQEEAGRGLLLVRETWQAFTTFGKSVLDEEGTLNSFQGQFQASPFKEVGLVVNEILKNVSLILDQ